MDINTCLCLLSYTLYLSKTTTHKHAYLCTIAYTDNTGTHIHAQSQTQYNTDYHVLFQTNIKVGQKLVGLPRDSRVGVLIDDSCFIHLYINGQDQGVAAPHLPQSCFRFLWCLRSLQTGETDLWYPYRQVRPIFDILTDRWDWSLISLQTGETDLWYPYRQVRLIFDILTDRWDWSLLFLQTGETDHWGPYRQVRLTTGVLTDRWDWSLISLQTGETDHRGPYRQVRHTTGVLTDTWDWSLGSLQTGETDHWGPYRQVRQVYVHWHAVPHRGPWSQSQCFPKSTYRKGRNCAR